MATTNTEAIIKSLAEMRAACSVDECELEIARNVCDHVRMLIYSMDKCDEQDVCKVLLDFVDGVLERCARDFFTVGKIASDARSIVSVE